MMTMLEPRSSQSIVSGGDKGGMGEDADFFKGLATRSLVMSMGNTNWTCFCLAWLSSFWCVGRGTKGWTRKEWEASIVRVHEVPKQYKYYIRKTESSY